VFLEVPEGFNLTNLVIPPTYAGRTLGELALRSQYNLHVLQISGAIRCPAPTPP